jgi:hypothetical protein
VTATTLRAQPPMLTSRGSSGGDAQERAATNPVAALPCARTPLPHPLPAPLLHPLLAPSSATVGVRSLAPVLSGLVEGSLGKLKLRRTTQSRWVADAVVTGRPPTNPVGGLPPGSPGHRRDPGHAGWSHG